MASTNRGYNDTSKKTDGRMDEHTTFFDSPSPLKRAKTKMPRFAKVAPQLEETKETDIFIS